MTLTKAGCGECKRNVNSESLVRRVASLYRKCWTSVGDIASVFFFFVNEREGALPSPRHRLNCGILTVAEPSRRAMRRTPLASIIGVFRRKTRLPEFASSLKSSQNSETFSVEKCMKTEVDPGKLRRAGIVIVSANCLASDISKRGACKSMHNHTSSPE